MFSVDDSVGPHGEQQRIVWLIHSEKSDGATRPNKINGSFPITEMEKNRISPVAFEATLYSILHQNEFL